MVGPPNFLNIRFLPLNLPKIFKRNMVTPISSQTLHISYMILLNWFNYIFFIIIILALIHKILFLSMFFFLSVFYLFIFIFFCGGWGGWLRRILILRFELIRFICVCLTCFVVIITRIQDSWVGLLYLYFLFVVVIVIS